MLVVLSWGHRAVQEKCNMVILIQVLLTFKIWRFAEAAHLCRINLSPKQGLALDAIGHVSGPAFITILMNLTRRFQSAIEIPVTPFLARIFFTFFTPFFAHFIVADGPKYLDGVLGYESIVIISDKC